MNSFAVLTTLVLLAVVTPLTRGYSIYRDRIPNGGQVPHPCKPNYLWRGVGHTNALGGGERNAFGKDFLAHGATWNKAICELDSDGDGLTNGQELGDPNCTWAQGSLPSRTSNITHPGICEPWNDSRCVQNNTWVTCDVDSLKCDALTDPDVKNVTLRFPRRPVPSTETNYICMTFDLPGDDVYQIVALEPYIDNEQVMHHILVYGCEGENPPSIAEPTACGMEATSGCEGMIAVWQVGYPGHCINENAGFVFGRGSFTRIKMEFHWNNPELRSDYTDASGMKIFYTANLRPQNLTTMMIGQISLEIPPLQPSVRITGTCDASCTKTILTKPIYVIQAMNHMHYLGRSQKIEVFRKQTLVATLSNDEVYSYGAPVAQVHDPPIEVLPGDEIRTTCEYSSQYKTTVTTYGEATSDEMCLGFLTVYPREAFPHTQICISFKERSPCESPQTPSAGTCDVSAVMDPSNSEVQAFIADVSAHCEAFEPCTPDCLRVMEPMKGDPCLQGPAFQVIKNYLAGSRNGLYFLAQLVSCKPRISCPECREYPTTPTRNNNNNNNNNNNIGEAAVLVPGMVSMVTMLLVAFLYN